MHFQLRTDNHIHNTEGLAGRVQAEVEAGVGPRFGARLHRVEVYIQDTNAHKGNGKRCAIEAHLNGHQPVAVHAEAADIDTALAGAVEKLEHALDHTIGKLNDRGGRVSMSGEPT